MDEMGDSMFRFGFKNRQREMLGLTITELRELKAELSDLKEQIRQIIPKDPEDTCKKELQAGDDWDYGDAADGDFPGPGEEYFVSDETDTGKGQGEPDNTGSEAETAIHSQGGPDDASCTVKDAACNIDESVENGVPAGNETVTHQVGEGSAETMAVEEAGEEVLKKRKEWAVVNYCRERKPWWKLWGRRGKVYGDYSGGGS